LLSNLENNVHHHCLCIISSKCNKKKTLETNTLLLSQALN
jgi:hypothetical protein